MPTKFFTFTYHSPSNGCSYKNEQMWLHKFLKEHCIDAKYSYEKGEKTNSFHFQGICELKEAKDSHRVFNKWLKKYKIWTSPAHSKTDTYVIKPETHIEGPWDIKDEDIYEEMNDEAKEAIEKHPRPFQKYILDKVDKDPEKRIIEWFWNEEGSNGKSWLCDYLEDYKGATCVFRGRGVDIREKLSHIPNQRLRTICFDIARTGEREVGNNDVYSVIEQVKRGRWDGTKGAIKSRKIKVPRVFCFSNKPPNRSKLSPDMWRVWQLDKNGNYIHDI